MSHEPKALGGSWYQLFTGKKVRGKKEAFRQHKELLREGFQPEEAETPGPSETTVAAPEEVLPTKLPDVCPVPGCSSQFQNEIGMRNHLERMHLVNPDRPDTWPAEYHRHEIKVRRKRSGRAFQK